MTFTGQAIPNSQGWYVLNIYDVNDLTDGLPKHSSGIHNNLSAAYKFGTYAFSYVYNEIYNADTINAKLNGKANSSHTHSISEISGGTSSNQYALTNANNTIYGSIGDGTMTVVPEKHDEVNFGGSTASDTIYFGYRARGSKPVPSTFIFGSPSGTSALKAGSISTSGNVTASGTITGSSVYGAVFN